MIVSWFSQRISHLCIIIIIYNRCGRELEARKSTANWPGGQARDVGPASLGRVRRVMDDENTQLHAD